MNAVTYSLDEEILARGYRWCAWGGPSLVTVLLLAAVLCYDAGKFFLLAAPTDRGWSALVVRYVTTNVSSDAIFALLLYYAYSYLSLPALARKRFREVEDLRRTYRMAWDDQGIKWDSDDKHFNYRRADVLRWSEKEDCFFILTNDGMLWMIRKRFFDGPEAVTSLRAWRREPGQQRQSRL